MNLMPTTSTARRVSPFAVALAAGGLFAAAPAASAGDIPPPEHIYSRYQTWTCPGLGVFQALYSPAGHRHAVMWLSPTGEREGGVLVALVWGDITLTLGGEVFQFVGPDHPAVREGQDQYTCSVYGVDGPDSIKGTARVAVIPAA